MPIEFLDEPAAPAGVTFLDPEPEEATEPEERPGRNPLLAPLVDIGKTVKALAVGPSEEYKQDFTRGLRKIATYLPSRSMVNAAMGLGDTVSDFGASAVQGAADAVGMEETAKDVREMRARSHAASDKWRAWNAEQNKDSVLGEYWAHIYMGAQENITESAAVGGAGGGLNAISGYYAVKAMQQSIREHPDRPGLAVAHGIIDGATTRFIGGKLNATMARLPAQVNRAMSPVVSRAAGRAAASVPSNTFRNALAGVPAEVIEEVVAEAGHYLADVGVGVEEFDGGTFAVRMRDAAVAAGVTAGAAQSMMTAGQVLADRRVAFDSAMEQELDRAEQELFDDRVGRAADVITALESAEEGPLTTEQQEAISAYTMASGMLNRPLRRAATTGGQVPGSVAQKADTLSKALRRLPTTEGTTYRGVLFPQEVWDSLELKEGKVFRDAGFASTSKDEATALSFADAGQAGGREGFVQAVFEIEGETGRQVESLTVQEGESEVLFDRNTPFRVVGITPATEGKPARVKLKEVKGAQKRAKVAKWFIEGQEDTLARVGQQMVDRQQRQQEQGKQPATEEASPDNLHRIEAELSQETDPARRAELEADRAEMVARFVESQEAVSEAFPEQSKPAPRSKAQRKIDNDVRRMGKARAEMTALEAEIIQGTTDVTEQRNRMMEAVNAAMPASKRLRIMQKAAGVRTEKGMKSFLAETRRTLERHDKKLATDSVKAAFKNAQRRLPDAQTKAQVEQVVADIDMGSPQSRKQLEALRDYVAQRPEFGTPPGFKEALERLDKTPLHKHTPTELRELASAIDNIVGEQARANQMISIHRDMTVESLAGKVVNEIADNKPRQSGLAGLAGSATSNAIFRPEDVANGLSPEVARLGWENIGVEGYRNEMRLRHSVMGDMRRQLRSLGLSPDRLDTATAQSAVEAAKRVGRGGTPLNQWRYETRSIGGKTMTRGEALHIYMLSLDPEARSRMFEHGASLQRTATSTLKGQRRGRVNMSEATLREIGEFVGDQGKQVAEHAFEKINTTLRDSINVAWKEVHGEPLSERTDYFPIRLDEDFAGAAKDAEQYFSNFKQFTLESYGVLKEREGASVPLSIRDGLDVYGRHVSTISRVSAYLAPVRDFHAVVRRPEVKDAVVTATSNATYEGLLDAVNQQILPVHDTSLWSSLPRKIVRGAGAAILGLRATTPFYNINSTVVAASRLPNGDRIMGQALRDLARPGAMQKAEADAKRLSPYWTERFENFTREMTSGMIGESSFFQPQGIDSLALKHIEVADKLGSLARWRAAEIHAQENLGIAPNDPRFGETVAREWERMTYRSESTSHGLESNGSIRAGRRHGLVSPFVQFESGASKTRSLLLAAKNDADKGQYRQASRDMAAWGANTILTSTFLALAAMARGSGDEEEFLNRIAETSLREGAPVVGDLMQQMYRSMRGARAFTGPSDTFSGVMMDTKAGAVQLSAALGQFITGEIDDEGDPKYRQTVIDGVAKMRALVGALTKVPIEGGMDSAKMIGNLTGLSGNSVDREIADVISGLREEKDTSDGRAKVWNAILTDDDEKFLAGIQGILESNPSALTAANLRNVVTNKFWKLRRIEQSPEATAALSEEGRVWMAEMQAERERLLVGLAEMVNKNAARIDSLTRGK